MLPKKHKDMIVMYCKPEHILNQKNRKIDAIRANERKTQPHRALTKRKSLKAVILTLAILDT